MIGSQFDDSSLARDYYMSIYETYVKSLREKSKPDEFTLNNHSTLAISLMGITHTLGMRYVLWEDRDISTELLNNFIKIIFFGIKESES